ncbi:DUF424 family protein [Candidatus Micrarchaeota archaeon]|nr:DUF424 family protein [Candidatus Micrarchaeota archaeon]
MSILLKIHESANGKVVAACDHDLIGRVLDDGTVYMDLDHHRSFYVGSKIDSVGLRDALSAGFYCANLVGKESISVAVSLGLIDKSDVLTVLKVPYVQIYDVR